MSGPRLLRLVERRPREVGLRRSHAEWLRSIPGRAVAVEALGGRRYRVEAKFGVGVANGPGLTLIVRPKVGRGVLSHLLGGSESPGPGGAPGEFFDLVAARYAGLFGHYVGVEGLRPGYEARANVEARGRIDFAAASRTPPARAHELPAVADDFSADRPAHRLMLRCARRLSMLEVLDESIRRELGRLAGVLGGQVMDDGMPVAEGEGCSLPPNGAEAFGLARQLESGAAGWALWLSMAALFEKFVGRELSPLARPGERWSAQESMTVSGSAGAEALALRPDYVLRRDGVPALVVDAKWKRFGGKPNPADVYQAACYAAHWDAGRAWLAYPSAARRTLIQAWRVGGQEVNAVTVPIGDRRLMDGWRERLRRELRSEN